MSPDMVASPCSVNSHPVYERRRRVEAHHIDGLGHVNNVAWLELVLELARDHCRVVGLGEPFMDELGGAWVVRRHELDYLAGAVAGEELAERTWVAENRGARCFRHAEFIRLSDGAPCLRARTEWVWVRREGLRPQRIPAPYLERIPGIGTEPGITGAASLNPELTSAVQASTLQGADSA